MIDFAKRYNEWMLRPIPSDIVNLIAQIQESKGRQSLFIQQQPDVLNSLLEVAKIQSTEASNKIEGIYTSNARMIQLMQDKTTPDNRNEEEIAGYRDVLNTIHDAYEYIPPTKNVILQLHRDLYKFTLGSNAGKWKYSDNIIQETDIQGNKRVRFIPTPAFEVDGSIDSLCIALQEGLSKQSNPLILIFTFILDFLCIHPFSDGNGRMSRLLTLLLLYRNEYIVGKYISIEKNIEQTKEKYYATLQESSKNWHEGTNDIYPFVRYMLEVTLASYIDFEDRVITGNIQNLTKKEQIRRVFDTQLGKVTKNDIRMRCPHISNAMIEKTVKELLDEGYLQKHGAGKATFYTKQ